MSVEKLELETLSPEDENDKGDSRSDFSETKFSKSHVEWYKRELHSSVSLPSGKPFIYISFLFLSNDLSNPQQGLTISIWESYRKGHIELIG